jgi:RNA polymerase sigma factor (TIGR02999 family)
MHRILVERGRQRKSLKRGGGHKRITLGDVAVISDDDDTDMAVVDDALERLRRQDARKHTVVMLRFFAGLTVDEAAEALQLSPATVKNEWSYAKAWLHRELSRTGKQSQD